LHRLTHDRDRPAGLLIGRGEQFERFVARLASADTTNESKRRETKLPFSFPARTLSAAGVALHTPLAHVKFYFARDEVYVLIFKNHDHIYFNFTTNS
jgi:hypothetical protein